MERHRLVATFLVAAVGAAIVPSLAGAQVLGAPPPPTVMLPPPPVVLAPPPPAPLYYVQPMVRSRHGRGIGLIVSGSVMLGLFWAGTAIAGSIVSALGDPRANFGFVPIAGPVIWAAPYNGSPEGTAAFILAILDTVVQGLGATFLLIGILVESTAGGMARAPTTPRFALVPAIGPEGASLAAVGRF